MKITQYGLSAHAGGWDPDGDSSTDEWAGNHGNVLHTASCALTNSAEALIAQGLRTDDPALLRDGNGQVIPSRLRPGALLCIVWDAKHRQYRTFDDRAPEADPRLDLFNPWAFDKTIPADFASVSVVG